MADKKYDTKLTMLFANREQRDILMKKELDEYLNLNRGFELKLVLDKVKIYFIKIASL